MTGKRYFVTCEVGNVICELISRKLSDDKFEHLTYYDIVDRLNQLTAENEQLKQQITGLNGEIKQLKECYNKNLNELDSVVDENEQLRNRINDWHQRAFKAHEYLNLLEKIIDEVCNDEISNQIWREYEKREELIE